MNIKKLSVLVALAFSSTIFTGCGAVKALFASGTKAVTSTGAKAVAGTGAKVVAAGSGAKAAKDMASNGGKSSGGATSSILDKADNISDIADAMMSDDQNKNNQNGTGQKNKSSAGKIGALAAAGTVAATAATVSAESNAPTDKHWIQSSNGGVYLWNPQPQDGESVEWSGGYVQDGNYRYAEGHGTTKWSQNGKVTQIDEGTFEHGQRTGQFKHEFPRSGRIEYSNWKNGVEITVTDEDTARNTFLEYHSAITGKDYNRAYHILTYSQQSRMGNYDNYVQGFSTTISSNVEDLKLIERNGNNYTFSYKLVARDRAEGNRVKVQTFNGKVTVVVEGNQGYIDFAKSQKINEYFE